MYHKNTSNIFRTGFTIIELLVAMVIISILATITIVSYTKIAARADIAVIQSDLSNGSKKLNIYRSTNDSYPTLMDNNNCPLEPTVDTNRCLVASANNTLAYKSDGTAYTLTETSPNGLKYSVTDSADMFAGVPIINIKLTISASENGTVNTDVNGYYTPGETQTIAATPNSGYVFDSWTGGVGCSGVASHTITMNTDITCIASFIEIPIITVDYLIVAGGGSGGNGGGGGGAGGVLTGNIEVSPQTYAIVVGDGGASVGTRDAAGILGQNSSFNNIVAIGGGAGGGYKATDGSVGGEGTTGGSGGGGGGGVEGIGGASTAGQGFKGGSTYVAIASGKCAGGGGGGAGEVGTDGTNIGIEYYGGKGGDGISSYISGTLTYYGGGGGGRIGSLVTTANLGFGGLGGGGNGGTGLTGSGTAGSVNTGSGGGGGGWAYLGSSGAGGSGIVIVRYLTGTISATGGSITTSDSYTIHTFTANGNFVIN